MSILGGNPLAPSCSRICWMNWSQQHSQTVPVQPQVKDQKKKNMRPLLTYGGPITPIATPEFIFCQVVFFGSAKLDTYLLWQSSDLLLLDEFS